jgi:hypothetical protein
MSHNTFDQFNDLMARLTAADGTVAEEHSHELPDIQLTTEVLDTIVGGLSLKKGRGNLQTKVNSSGWS